MIKVLAYFIGFIHGWWICKTFKWQREFDWHFTQGEATYCFKEVSQ